MKYWLSHLPLEVWVDVFVFPWITREELVRIADTFRNRKYAEYLQFYLHKWGKRSLGTLQLDKKTLPNIPRTPMPENIKFFKDLTIRHFDFRTVAFLHRISTLFNANDVNLSFHSSSQDDFTKYRTVLDHLAPLLHGIHSLDFKQKDIPLVEQYFSPKLAQVKMITLFLPSVAWLAQFDPTKYEAVIDFCLNWLTSTGERDPAEPKFLKVCAYTKVIQLFSNAIQQQFLSTKSPCTFAIEFFERSLREQHILNDFHLKNRIGEQLHRQKSDQYMFQIFRHQPNAGTALQEWVKATVEKSRKSSHIRIGPPYFDRLTIGQIDANADNNEGDDDEEGDQLFACRILCAIIGVMIMIKFVSSVRHSAH